MNPATALARPEQPLLPDVFTRWFAGRGWAPRAHQLELLAKARDGRSVLLTDGDWKIARAVWNIQAPQPAPPPAKPSEKPKD